VQGYASKTTITNQHDIALLSTTVSYYSSLREQFQLLAPLCERLKKIATVFHRLALVQIGHETSEQGQALVQPVPASEGQNVGLFDSNAILSLEQMQVQLGDEIGVDLEQYLEWLPVDVFPIQSDLLGDVSTGDMAGDTLNSLAAGVRDKGPRGTKRPFDVMFDWFAWDSY
jgi:hypothetical protein